MIVTGASSGIGLATSIELIKQGALLAMAARRLDVMTDALNNADIPMEKCLLIQADVTEEEDCKRIIAETIKQWGKIDVLINNAGISMRALFADLDLNVMKEVMDVNFWGTVYCTKYALPHIMKSDGTIVGVSSIAGYKGLPARTAYSASKFAMQGFLDSLRIELLKTKVHVMIICPGYTESNIRKQALNAEGKAQGESPLAEANLMSAEEVAKELIAGITKRRREIILTSQGKNIVRLNKFFPAWMDKMVYKVVSREKDSSFK